MSSAVINDRILLFSVLLQCFFILSGIVFKRPVIGLCEHTVWSSTNVVEGTSHNTRDADADLLTTNSNRIQIL